MKNDIFNLIKNKSPHLSWIDKKAVFLTKHGSQAYGTNIATSDTDIKGICIPPLPYYLGSLHRLEQIELKNPDPDCVIYEIRKFFTLAIDCNPSIIEVLHTDSSDHLYVDSIGEIILDHRNDFLSKKVKHTFTGYAISQLKRLNLHKKYIVKGIKEPPNRKDLGLPEAHLIPSEQLAAVQAEIQKELDKESFDFMDNLEESTKIGIRSAMSEMLAELKITSEDHWMAAARKIGLNDNFIEIMKKEREFFSKKREYDQYINWKKNRNSARAALEEKYFFDTKNAMHLIRLMRMCKEILTTGKVIVKRPDREELISIRNGAWSYEQVIEFADTQEKELNVLYNTCNFLPKAPNKEKLDKLCISLVEKSNSKYSLYNLKKMF